MSTEAVVQRVLRSNFNIPKFIPPPCLTFPFSTPRDPALLLSCLCYPCLHKEDYETFKACMEEKEDRQDVIASSFEETQARLNDAEASILALTDEVATVDQAMQARTGCGRLEHFRCGLVGSSGRACLENMYALLKSL